MPVWQWLLDAAVLLLVLLLCYGVGLIVRRRVLSRHGGTFELSYRVGSTRTGRGWLLGLGRYSGETLEWFRIFSLSPRPKASWLRSEAELRQAAHPPRVPRSSRCTPITWSSSSGTGTVARARHERRLADRLRAWLEAVRRARTGTSARSEVARACLARP